MVVVISSCGIPKFPSFIPFVCPLAHVCTVNQQALSLPFVEERLLARYFRAFRRGFFVRYKISKDIKLEFRQRD